MHGGSTEDHKGGMDGKPVVLWRVSDDRKDIWKVRIERYGWKTAGV